MGQKDTSRLSSKEVRKQYQREQKAKRAKLIKARIQTRRDEHCIWHYIDGSYSSCSLKPLDDVMKKRTGNTHERTECYGSPTACRYKALHTPQSAYNQEPMAITDWMTKYRRPEWFPLLMDLCHTGAENVCISMTALYYSLEVFIELPLDPNKKIGVMIEIVNMQPDQCSSTANQTEEHKASVKLLFKSPDEQRIGY